MTGFLVLLVDPATKNALYQSVTILCYYGNAIFIEITYLVLPEMKTSELKRDR